MNSLKASRIISETKGTDLLGIGQPSTEMACKDAEKA